MFLWSRLTVDNILKRIIVNRRQDKIPKYWSDSIWFQDIEMKLKVTFWWVFVYLISKIDLG